MDKRRLDIGPYRRPLRPQERAYLEQRWQEYRTVPKWQKLITVWTLSTVLVMTSSMFTYTHSYFHDSAVNAENTFQATHIDRFLFVEPGDARATFPSVGDPRGEVNAVAYNENGQLFLDFGEVPDGNGKLFKDVIRMNNITTQHLNVEWYFEGAIADIFSVREGNFILPPLGHKSTSPYSLDLKLKVNSEPGYREGYLVINVNGQFLTLRIPAKALVRKTSKETVDTTTSSDTTNSIPLNDSEITSQTPITEEELPQEVTEPSESQQIDVDSSHFENISEEQTITTTEGSSETIKDTSTIESSEPDIEPETATTLNSTGS